jgi:flagellar protein FliS
MNRYFEETIRNADPIDLIRLLYQRAISSVEDAREHLREKRIAKRSAAIIRAYAVVAELIASLRPEAAPELTRQLRRLYSYILQRLMDANMQQAEKPLIEVLELLKTLEEGWAGASAALSSGEAAAVSAGKSAGIASGAGVDRTEGERFAVHV